MMPMPFHTYGMEKFQMTQVLKHDANAIPYLRDGKISNDSSFKK